MTGTIFTCRGYIFEVGFGAVESSGTEHFLEYKYSTGICLIMCIMLNASLSGVRIYRIIHHLFMFCTWYVRPATGSGGRRGCTCTGYQRTKNFRFI
jgi:hypothetical protein